MWSIVEFPSADPQQLPEVAVVVSAWLQGDGECWWPKCKSPFAVNNAVQTLKMPDVKTFFKCKYTPIIREYGNIIIVRFPLFYRCI